MMVPIKRSLQLKNFIDIAFDSEFYVKKGQWNPETGLYEVLESTLISIQFAVSETQRMAFYPLKPSITWEELLDYAFKFLEHFGIEVPESSSGRRNIYFIVFYGYAELSNISDFRGEETEIQLYSGKAVSIVRKVMRDDAQYVLHMVDLRGYFKTSLKALAKTVGSEKLEINIDGRDDSYWKQNMLELYRKHPDLFEQYALRDVEVTIKVWNELKKGTADPHKYHTLAGIAMADFRSRFMKRYAVQHTMLEERYARKVGSEYKAYMRKRVIFDGSYDIRKYACMSYAGGNNQAFIVGHRIGLDAKFCDFVSLYVASAMIQPLPNESTQYKKLTLADVPDHEGWCKVDFKFPQNERYPCLPIQLGVLDKLMFPLKGTSWCTLAELRQAQLHGAEISGFSGYGFRPDESEIKHDLAPYFKELLDRKNELKARGDKGPEYEMLKSKLVDTVGKFGARSKKYNVRAIGAFIKRMPNPDAFREIASTKIGREMYEARGAVANTWTPEWASLIVGQARAAADEAIHSAHANCLFISTDGGVWDSDPHFNKDPGPLLKRMLLVGGGMHSEGAGDGSVDELWIAKNRLYCTWYKGSVVKFARMSCALHEEEFEPFIRESLRLGRQAAEKTKRMILTGMFQYDFKNVPINSELVQEIAIGFREDGKRVLLNPKVNIWKEWTDTRPYETLQQAFDNWYDVKPRGGQRVNLTAEQVAEIKAADAKITHAELAMEYNVSVSTIKRIRRDQ